MLVTVLLVFALLACCILYLPSHIAERDLMNSEPIGSMETGQPSKRLETSELLKAKNDIRTILLQAAGGLFFVATALFTWRQVRLKSDEQITDRFAKAIDHIGEDMKTDVCLGGIHALDRIAKDSKHDRETIIDILVQYIQRRAPKRTPSLMESHNNDQHDKATVEHNQRASASRLFVSLRARAPDVQAALDTLGRSFLDTEGITHLELQDVDFRLVQLRDAGFLARADLSGADLSGADLSGADLARADLARADLARADLARADLSRTILWGADLSGADLSGADLSGANLSGAVLSGATLWDANLTGANLTGANSSRARLTGANLTDANLTDANLTDANLSGANLSRARLTGTNLCSTNLWGTNLSRTNLMDVSLSGADLSGANLSGANLSGANLSGANLSRARLTGTNLCSTNLSRADLSRADLSRANLSRTNLMDAKFWGANLTDANLTGANLTGAKSIMKGDNATIWPDGFTCNMARVLGVAFADEPETERPATDDSRPSPPH